MKSSDVAALGAFLTQVPAESRSAAAVKVVNTVASSPEAMKKLATDGFAVTAQSLATSPTDAGVSKAITDLMTARNGGAQAAPAWGQKPKPAATETGPMADRPWLTDNLRRSYGKNDVLPVHMAQAVNKEGYVDPMDSSGKRAMAQTRGWGSDRTVGVKCSFEVGLINPRTGKHETVLFKGVEDHRKAPWGVGSYDTAKDINSEVLVCTGQNYEKGRPNPRDPMNYVSGSMTSVSATDYRSIPDLKRRVEQWLATGATGNDKK